MFIRFSTIVGALAVLSMGASAATSTSNAASNTETALIAPTTAAAGVAPGAGVHGYSYAGCYNETTGFEAAGNVRALAGGSMVCIISRPGDRHLSDLCPGIKLYHHHRNVHGILRKEQLPVVRYGIWP